MDRDVDGRGREDEGKRIKRLRRDPSSSLLSGSGGARRGGEDDTGNAYKGDGGGRGKSKSRSRVRVSGGDGVRGGGVIDEEDEDEDGEEEGEGEGEGEGEDVGVLLGEWGILLGACPEVGCASRADEHCLRAFLRIIDLCCFRPFHLLSSLPHTLRPSNLD